MYNFIKTFVKKVKKVILILFSLKIKQVSYVI